MLPSLYPIARNLPFDELFDTATGYVDSDLDSISTGYLVRV